MHKTQLGERRRRGAPLFAFDAAWVLQREGPLAGADEAGRGAFAGPLVAAAVVLGGGEVFQVDDSKSVSGALREEMAREVARRARAVSVVSFPAWWIDERGVGVANKEALRRAISLVEDCAGCGLADGNLALGSSIECLPRADGLSAAVASASVVAKVLRDAAMEALALDHPGYGFESNKGYGTPKHRAALAEVGPCRVHRLSYAGVGSV